MRTGRLRTLLVLGGIGLLASSAATTFLLVTVLYYRTTTGRWVTHLVFDLYSEHVIEVPLLALGGVASLYEGIRYLLYAFSRNKREVSAVSRETFLYSLIFLWVSAVLFLQIATGLF